MKSFDIVFCADLRRPDEQAARLGATIAGLVAKGARIGVLPVASTMCAHRRWAPALRDQLASDEVEAASAERSGVEIVDPYCPATAHLVVLWPLGLALARPSPGPKLSADRMIAYVGSDEPFEPAMIDERRLLSNLRDFVDAPLRVAPSDDEVRRRLTAGFPQWPLTAWNWEASPTAPQIAERKATSQETQNETQDETSGETSEDAGAADALWRCVSEQATARPNPQERLAKTARTRRHILFLSPNGVGVGHLTRLLAIARRLPSHIEPVFLTMSYAAGVIERAGFVVEFFPKLSDDKWWTAGLRARIGEMVDFYRCEAVVADVNVPYAGLTQAREDMADVPYVWVRRGMWREAHGGDVARRERYFDVILAPSDFAQDYDRGVTTDRDAAALPTAPITLLDASEAMSRAEARRALKLPDDKLCGLVMLGSGSNFDMTDVEAVARRRLALAPNVEHRVLRWTISTARDWRSDRKSDAKSDGGSGDPREISLFPIARYFPAFDFAISAVGYNSFHELLAARMPTIFVPNEHPSMDDQIGRAVFAERRGYALSLRQKDRGRADQIIDQLLDPTVRAQLSDRCAALPAADGASDAARIIADLVEGVRAFHPLDGLR